MSYQDMVNTWVNVCFAIFFAGCGVATLGISGVMLGFFARAVVGR